MCELKREGTQDAAARRCGALFALLCLGACVLARLDPPCAAQAEPPVVTAGAPAGAAAPSAEDEAGVKIVVNGYLSQAYAASDGNQIVGIPKQGTTDYRTAAVQMRAEVTPEDTFSVKLRHERIGDSPFQVFQPDVGLDWLFYEHRFGASAVRVGRVKIPFGIFNEVRDVGTLLPFYRPPADFYGAGSFTTETVDGALLTHSCDLGRGWRLVGDAYFGNWEFVASELEGVFRSKARNTVGVELRLDTPLPGLQISAGEMDYKVVKEEEGGPIVSPSRSYHLSVEGTYRRLVTHVEYKYRHTADAKVDSGYVHVGYRLTDKLTANLQAEGSHVSLQELPQGIDQDMDRALGVSYTLRPGLVLKAEHHWNRGFSAVLPATGLAGPKLKTRYAILSLSTSF